MIVIMRDAIMPDCCNTCVCSEGYGCGITGTIMTTKEMESRPDWCPLEEVEPCGDAVRREDVQSIAEKSDWFESSDSFNDFMWALYALPSVQPEPCEDTISRADAIRVASGYCHPANVAQELAKLPSVQPDNSCDGCRYENADDGVLIPCGFCKRSHPDNYEGRIDDGE